MTTEGEQQEAVCGACGVYRARIDKSCPRCGAEFIPPPVVPYRERDANAAFIANPREDIPYLLSLIDSLTTERDQLRLMFDTEHRVAAIESGLLARAEAAEADRERLREVLRKVEVAHFDQWCALCLGGEAPALHKPDCPVGAALATPPSEGQS